jgi:hypothetical protein
MKRKKLEHSCTPDRARKLRRHILDGITRVLMRPRFGITVEESAKEKYGVKFSHGGIKYYLQVTILDLVVVIEVMTDELGHFYDSIYSSTFPVRQIESVNKIGTVIANKVKTRTVMLVMSE